MSTYHSKALRPGGEVYEDVIMIDDYYGHHIYGVKFPDGSVYKGEDCVEDNVQPFYKTVVDSINPPTQINGYKYTNIHPFNVFHGKIREMMEETITLMVEDYADERKAS